MDLSGHLKTAPLLGALYFTSGIEAAMIAISASLLIDIDHLHLIIRERAFSVQKIRALASNIYGQGSIQRYFLEVTYALHSLETNLLIMVIALLWWRPAAYIAAGFAFHVICDIIHHRRLRLPIMSWLLLSDYFIRRFAPKR